MCNCKPGFPHDPDCSWWELNENRPTPQERHDAMRKLAQLWEERDEDAPMA